MLKASSIRVAGSLNSTLADLYDVDVMPQQLRRAHQELDKAVDRLYRPAPFTGDSDRVEHLFGLYERVITPSSPQLGGRARLAQDEPKT